MLIQNVRHELDQLKKDVKIDTNSKSKEQIAGGGAGLDYETESRIASLESKVKRVESTVAHISEAIELIKTYGFQPKQFEELLKIYKEEDTATTLETNKLSSSSTTATSTIEIAAKIPEPPKKVTTTSSSNT